MGDGGWANEPLALAALAANEDNVSKSSTMGRDLWQKQKQKLLLQPLLETAMPGASTLGA